MNIEANSFTFFKYFIVSDKILLYYIIKNINPNKCSYNLK